LRVESPEIEPDEREEDDLPFVAAAPSGWKPVHLDEHGNVRIIEIRFEVEEEYEGWRLDLYLKKKIPRLSRTKIQKIVETQLEGEGGVKKKVHSPVRAGEKLLIRRPARPEPPCPLEFGVLAEGDGWFVVDKPAGLPVHASARYYFGTLSRLLFDRFGDDVQIAHRLDRETSGCLVVARGRRAAAALKRAFEERRVSKVYRALVYGVPEWPEGHVIDLPLALVPKSRSKLGVRMEPAGRADGLDARTRVRVVSAHGRCAVVECRPITGRQHQIRAHLAAVGHPIVGDKLYAFGDEAFARYCDRAETMTVAEVEAEFGMARQALHAAAITFPDPASGGASVTVESPLPADMRRYIDRCVEVV
jgi:23S rRNA pseudouridine1911/1915/1917 synthase